MAFENPGDRSLRRLLQESQRIAVVGLSPKPGPDSNHLAAYLQQRRYEMDRGMKVEHARPLGPTC